ncbi:MAG: hypothetical protein WA749_08245 [Gelidibacter sp.]
MNTRQGYFVYPFKKTFLGIDLSEADLMLCKIRGAGPHDINNNLVKTEFY